MDFVWKTVCVCIWGVLAVGSIVTAWKHRARSFWRTF